ncbi:glycosyltransferase family 2 protein, partial [candidate division FCPU426 bacterium]|nr:glycosyltransferase family 2 protein [candidate division FCPU426 bacterium]
MLTVLAIAYNQRLYTEMLLSSLCRAECADMPYQLVFIDNGSIDGTQELVNTYPLAQNQFFRGLIYHAFPDNRGVAAAINQGFALAKTDFVLQADNDVVFGPQSLSLLYAWMMKHPQGLISPNWPWIQKKLGTSYFTGASDITPRSLQNLKRLGL